MNILLTYTLLHDAVCFRSEVSEVPGLYFISAVKQRHTVLTVADDKEQKLLREVLIAVLNGIPGILRQVQIQAGSCRFSCLLIHLQAPWGSRRLKCILCTGFGGRCLAKLREIETTVQTTHVSATWHVQCATQTVPVSPICVIWRKGVQRCEFMCKVSKKKMISLYWLKGRHIGAHYLSAFIQCGKCALSFFNINTTWSDFYYAVLPFRCSFNLF